MRINIDTELKVIVLLDTVTFNEIDGVMEEIKKLINDDLNLWKIQTAPVEKEAAPITYPQPFPHQPFSPPFHPWPITPYPVNPYPLQPTVVYRDNTGNPIPHQQHFTTSPNVNSTATCKTDFKTVN